MAKSAGFENQWEQSLTGSNPVSSAKNFNTGSVKDFCVWTCGENLPPRVREANAPPSGNSSNPVSSAKNFNTGSVYRFLYRNLLY